MCEEDGLENLHIQFDWIRDSAFVYEFSITRTLLHICWGCMNFICASLDITQ